MQLLASLTHELFMSKRIPAALKEYTLLFSVDDEAIVPVGEPSNPISSGVCGHNRSLITVGGPTLAALDYDFHLFPL